MTLAKLMPNLLRMITPLPPLSCFRAFEATARHLSFTLAAKEMNVTQSAVSQQVRTLENRLGQPLFDRKTKRLTLTDAGRRLVPFAASAIAELIRGTEMFAAARDRETVSVSCTTSFAQLWLVSQLKGFSAAHPGIAVQITSTLWPDDYLPGKTDVEVHFGRLAQLNRQATLLMPIQFVPVCSPTLSGPIAGLDDLWELPLIETVGALYGWSRWTRQFGVSVRPTPAFVVDSMILAQTTAIAGLGVALVSPALCHGALSSGQIHVVLDLPTLVEDCFYFSVMGASADRPAVKAFCDWLEGAATPHQG
ncbi:LysR family transcriptional regulator [Roseovarius sp. Pro17]|uniref:LysR family transcriptional regulator n=1 Tax=Roseovarius sp. Pro17 TaxID=3108175 RepID=UPI002D779D10|nr:LysR family transcriptional regulator [Roseovarius sp. Pro17]